MEDYLIKRQKLINYANSKGIEAYWSNQNGLNLKAGIFSSNLTHWMWVGWSVFKTENGYCKNIFKSESFYKAVDFIHEQIKEEHG